MRYQRHLVIEMQYEYEQTLVTAARMEDEPCNKYLIQFLAGWIGLYKMEERDEPAIYILPDIRK